MFHFFIWDGERTLEEVEANTLAFDDDESPPRLFQKLRENAEFRLQFADRVHRHLSSDGALTPAAAAERFRAWTGRLDKPIVAESARWGDYRRDVHAYKVGPYVLYTRDGHWRPETERLLKQYFPQRTAILLQQFRQAGLYPEIEAPTARQVEHALAWSAPAGSIYYTLDGSDPRLPGGQLAASGRKYETPLLVPPGRKIKARAVTGQGASLQWSALAEVGAGP